MGREQVQAWVDAYVRWWRASDPAGVPELFTPDVRYLRSPYEEPLVGHAEPPVVGGLAAPLPVGLPLLLLLLALVGWLTYLSWPAVVGGGRVVRLATVAMVAAAVVLKVVGG